METLTMWDFLIDTNQAGTTIILTTHYLEEAENLCRDLAIIDQGKIVVRDRMQNVLRKLQVETFVLNVDNKLEENLAVPGFEVRRRDDCTLEADIGKGRGLNDLFAALSEKNIQVSSMRNKANRLEAMFMRLVEKKTWLHKRELIG